MCSNISSCLYCTVLTLRLTGPCHAYVQQRGRTGGWTDVWCPHETKIGAKLEALQAGNRSKTFSQGSLEIVSNFFKFSFNNLPIFQVGLTNF